MTESHINRYFFITILLAASVLGVLLLWPFITVILLSVALSVVFYPVFRWFNKKVTGNRQWLSSLFTVILFILILCVPLFTIGITVFKQSQGIYNWIVEHGSLNEMVGRIEHALYRIFPAGSVSLEERVTEMVGSFTAGIGSIFSATITTIFSLFLVILSMFYFLKDGSHWKQTVLRMSPLANESNEKIIERLRSSVNGILKGYLLIAVIQGVLMGIGLWIFGVPNPALFGVLAGVASLIPTIGTALVSIPAIMYLFAAGDTAQAIGLAAWAAVLVGTIDNLLNPIVVGRKIEIHPLLVLFAVLGGIILMGPVGILIGPLIISFIYALTSVYREEMKR